MLCHPYNSDGVPYRVLPDRGRSHETHANGEGCGACGFGLASRASGGPRRHRPAQLCGSVRQRAGGADESGGNPVESRAVVNGAPVRFQKAIPGLKENAAVERREARRSALWIGSSLPLEGQAMPQGRPTGRRSGPRLSALRYPLMGMRRVRNRQFGTTARRDAPRGNDAPRLDRSTERK